MTQRSFVDLLQAVEQLPYREQEELAVWVHQLLILGSGVAEPVAAYAVPKGRLLTVEQYLEFEATSQVRHEYVGGELYAMSGVSIEHHRIARNLLITISNHLRGGPCQTFISDVKVRLEIDECEIFYYPDLMVVCGEQVKDKHFLTAPRLVVEVLSPATQAIDRREKALNYRRAPSIEEYVLVAPHKCEVTIQRRSESWTPTVLDHLDAAIELHSLDFTLPVREVYRAVLSS
jgi:Uma2 family endonuclease